MKPYPSQIDINDIIKSFSNENYKQTEKLAKKSAAT